MQAVGRDYNLNKKGEIIHFHFLLIMVKSYQAMSVLGVTIEFSLKIEFFSDDDNDDDCVESVLVKSFDLLPNQIVWSHVGQQKLNSKSSNSNLILLNMIFIQNGQI